MNMLPIFHRRVSSVIRHYMAAGWICAIIAATGFSSLANAEFSEKVVEHSKQSTVRVVAKVGDRFSMGTGLVISAKGYVVTNFHVVKDGEKVVVVYGRGGTAFMKQASVVVSDPTKDLVILKCDSLPRTETFVVADHETTGGQEVMAIGFPGILDDLYVSHGTPGLKPSGGPDEFTINSSDIAGFVPVSFSGNVGKEMRIESGFGGDYRAIAHSAKISEGNSGGPLIDKDGRLVGINARGAANRMGADYAFAIHASELVALARSHSISIDVTSSKASSGGFGGGSNLQTLLLIVLAAFAVVMFLLVLRKPRMVMVDAVSKLVHSRHSDSPPPGRRAHSPAHAASSPPLHRGTMRLRGRDLHGLSYDLSFTEADFRRCGGRLVIGRNNDLSQLLLAHDSVSRQHSTLTLNGAAVQVEDRNSGNGTKVNGRDLAVGAAPVALQPGDRLTLGEVELVFEVFH